MPCGGPSTSGLPASMPAGYESHTGYQYDSISRVAGQRELAPPSKFSKLGGFNNNVFITSGILHPQASVNELALSNHWLLRLGMQWKARAYRRSLAPNQ